MTTPTAVERTVAGLRRFGRSPALEHAGTVTTYTDLADQIDALATRLRDDLRIQAGAAALVTTRHTPSTITAILACVRAGITYVPVPEDVPPARLGHIRTAVRPAVHLHDGDGTIVAEHLAAAPAGHRTQQTAPLAVLHTSGSTGAPKSVTIDARNLDHFLLWCRGALPLTSADRLAVLSPLHFDLCTHDIYHGLYSGATLVVPDDHERTSPQAAGRFVAASGITRMYMVPTFLERVATSVVRSSADADHVRTVMFAGERLTSRGRNAVEQAFPRASLHNLYGPIETNVVTALHVRRGTAHDSADVGAALPGVALGIRHPDGTLHGDGRGELTVSGTAVTPGYLDPAHNAAKFTVSSTGEPVYRTGDEATLTPTGEVRLHGRLDTMVKIRGHRIELDEVEAVLLAHDHVSECGVVLAATGDDLDAFVLPAAGPAPRSDDLVHQLLAHCKAELPEAAVPARIHVLDRMPVTSTGKIDRQSLKSLRRNNDSPHPTPVAEPTGAVADPERVIEQILSDRLNSNPDDLRALPVLREHPAFNSLVAAQVVEAVEDFLGCTADYDRFTARTFDSITSMGDLFVHRT